MKAKLTEEIVQLGDINQIYLEELSIWTVLFFSIGVIGVFFSVILNLRKKREIQSCLMIGAYMLLHSFFCVCLSLHLFDADIDTSSCLFMVTLLTVLNEPLLYLYFKRVTEKVHMKSKDFFHGIPLLFFTTYWLLTNVEIVVFVCYKIISMLVYLLMTYKVYKKKTEKRKKSELELTIWLRNIVRLSFFFLGTFILSVLAWLKFLPHFFAMYPLLLSGSSIILYVAYTAYVKPDIFSRPYLFKEGTFFKYKKSGLTDGYSEELRNQLQLLFERDKIYRNSNLNLESLSEELGTTRHNVSQVINEHFEMNFFQFVNRYRIEDAVHMFEESNYHDLKIINIAYDVGFNNKVTFNKAFKAEMHMTPTIFIENMKRKKNKKGKNKVTTYRES